MKQRLFNLAIALDQFVFCVLTLGHSAPDETASAAAWRLEQEGRLAGRIFRPLIDALARPFEQDHCRNAYHSEMLRAQLPRAYRQTHG